MRQLSLFPHNFMPPPFDMPVQEVEESIDDDYDNSRDMQFTSISPSPPYNDFYHEFQGGQLPSPFNKDCSDEMPSLHRDGTLISK